MLFVFKVIFTHCPRKTVKLNHSLTHFTRPRGQISGSRVGHQRYRALLMVPTVGPHCCIVLKCWTLVIIQCDTNFVVNGVFSAGEGDVYPPDWHWKWGVGIHRGSGWQVVTKRGRIPGKWNMADEHSCSWSFNSLFPGGRSGNNFEIIILELIYWIDILINSYEIVLWRMPKHHDKSIHDKSTLVQVMA